MQLDRQAARRIALALTAVSALLVGATLLINVAYAGRVLPGTRVVGVDVGGRDPWSARRDLVPALEREGRRAVAVSVPGQLLHVRPIDAGVRFDVDATVDSAYQRGRRTAGVAFVQLAGPARRSEVLPRTLLDAAALERWLDDAIAQVEREADAGDLLIDPSTLSVGVRGPRGGVAVDRAESLARLTAALVDPRVDRIELATSTTLPPASRASVEGLADRVRIALAGPLVLEHEGRSLSIEPSTLARLLVVDVAGTGPAAGPQLSVQPDRLEALLGSTARSTFDGEAVDARIITPDLPPTSMTELSSATFTPIPADIEVVPGRSRARFVPQMTARQLVRMVLEEVRVAEADLIVAAPALTTVDANEGRPTHLLGTFTTFHPAGAARTINIRLLADLLDDRLIAPGETFSINGASGPRRCEDGFVPAGTIIRGELVDTCGGGVSQFGTTMMNAAFFAGLPLAQWQPHSFFISRYPAGREATLNYPDLDVRFVNDTEGFIVLRTSHTPESITVALYGVPAWRRVEAAHGERRSPTDFGEVVRPAADLPPGRRRVVQEGGRGFTVTVTRTRLPLDDREASVERWTTVYRPQQRIIEVGVTVPPPVSPGAEPAGAAPPAAVDAASDD